MRLEQRIKVGQNGAVGLAIKGVVPLLILPGRFHVEAEAGVFEADVIRVETNVYAVLFRRRQEGFRAGDGRGGPKRAAADGKVKLLGVSERSRQDHARGCGERELSQYSPLVD